MDNLQCRGSILNNMIIQKIKEVEEPNIPSKIGSMTSTDKVPIVDPKSFSERLNKLFTINPDIYKLCIFAENEVNFWINKFISDGSLKSRFIDGLEILVKPNDIPDNESRNMFGRLQPSIDGGFIHNQLIVNVGYCIINYQGEWKDIYKSLEDFIGNVALHEVSHLVAWNRGAELRNELMHGPTWIKYYTKYRSMYTKVPLEISKDGLITNFNKTKFTELWDNDFIILKPYVCNDGLVITKDGPRMGE